jgi:hypothetical protein
MEPEGSLPHSQEPATCPLIYSLTSLFILFCQPFKAQELLYVGYVLHDSKYILLTQCNLFNIFRNTLKLHNFPLSSIN